MYWLKSPVTQYPSINYLNSGFNLAGKSTAFLKILEYLLLQAYLNEQVIFRKVNKFMRGDSILEFSDYVTSGVAKPGRYAVILAGGDGTRLRSLTRAISGDDRPKQFCPVLGGETLLENTTSRVSISIPRQNIYYSLTEKHRHFYAPLIAGIKRDKLIVQPENKGTTPAILYSLFRLANADPEAMVGFFPSDHYFSDDTAFMAHVETAYKATERKPEALVLLGIEAKKAETGYGWIEPAETVLGAIPNSITEVRRFWEKPSIERAMHLMKSGCLWNSFVMVGKVSAFQKLIKQNLPDLYQMFAASSVTFGTGAEVQTIRALYSWINESNFSSEVLETSASELRVLRVGDVGWSDLGEPQRVLGTLTQLGVETNWMAMVS